VIGEGVACLVWAKCLLVWSRQRGLLVLFAALFAAVLFAYGISELILRTFHKDLFILLTSTITTTTSALMLVLQKTRAREEGRAVGPA